MTSSPQHRARLVLRLTGGEHADGEIPLDRLADIARRTQELLVRIGRSLTGREGVGRTPADVREATRLTLIALGSGSTSLEIAGPPVEPRLDLGEQAPPDVTGQSMDALGDALEALGTEEAPSIGLSEAVADSLDSWLGTFEGYEALSASVQEDAGRSWSVTLSPVVTRTRLRQRRASSSGARESTARQVEGELYAVNFRSGYYRLEDDIGNSIALRVTPPRNEWAGALVGHRVRAVGDATLDQDGLIRELSVTELRRANGESFEFAGGELREQDDVQQRLESAPRIALVEELQLEGLTDDEADAFWAAIEEARGG